MKIVEDLNTNKKQCLQKSISESKKGPQKYIQGNTTMGRVFKISIVCKGVLFNLFLATQDCGKAEECFPCLNWMKYKCTNYWLKVLSLGGLSFKL